MITSKVLRTIIKSIVTSIKPNKKKKKKELNKKAFNFNSEYHKLIETCPTLL